MFYRPNKKREYKNKKFGFGGQKKRSKHNTSTSAGDVSDFNPRVNQKRPGHKMKKVLNIGMVLDLCPWLGLVYKTGNKSSMKGMV